MFLTLLIGFIAGIALIIYRGLYFGPWPAAINTMGTALASAIVLYVFLQILASVGSFFLRVLLVLIFAAVILIGGRKLWNTFNPDNPINLPTAVSNSIDGITSRLW